MNLFSLGIVPRGRFDGTRFPRGVGAVPMVTCTSPTRIAARAASKACLAGGYRDRAGVLPGGVGCPSRGAGYEPFPFPGARFPNRPKARTVADAVEERG